MARRVATTRPTKLRARSEVRVHVRALLGTVAKLRLHGLDGVPAGDRLACDRVATEGVMAHGAKPKGPLHDHHGPLVAVDVAREGPVL